MKKLLGNDKLVIRFLSLYALGLVIFFISWTISYFFLPEGLLRGFGPLSRLAGDTAADTQYQEFIKIFLLNSFGFLIIVIGNYILRIKYFSFGYLIPLAWFIMYAVTLGTNSFSIPMETTLAPSLTVFGRSGLYEMMAYVLFAISTDTISINQSNNFFSSSKRIPKEKRVPMKKNQWFGVGIAFLILAIACFREASMIVNL